LFGLWFKRFVLPRSFEHDFALVRNVDGHKDIVMPDSATHQQDFVDWAERLPEKQTPSWLGLPNNAEKLLLTNLGSFSFFLFNLTKQFGFQMLLRCVRSDCPSQFFGFCLRHREKVPSSTKATHSLL